MPRLKLRALFLLLSLIFAGCEDGTGHVPADPPDPPEDDLFGRQKIVYFQDDVQKEIALNLDSSGVLMMFSTDPNAEISSATFPTENNASGVGQLVGLLRGDCNRRVPYFHTVEIVPIDKTIQNVNTNAMCYSGWRIMAVATCMVETAIEIANAVEPTVLSLPYPNTNSPVVDFVFPVQDAASRAALHEIGLLIANWEARRYLAPWTQTRTSALGEMLQELAGSASDCAKPALFSASEVGGTWFTPAPPPTYTRLDALITQIQDLYNSGVAAGRAAADDYVALADAAYGEYTTIDVASRIAGERRNHAANLLIGGVSTGVMQAQIAANPTDASRYYENQPNYFVPYRAPTGAAARALELIRRTAPHPSIVQAIPGFIGAQPVVDSESFQTLLRERYGRLLNLEDRLDATTNEEFLSSMGFTESDLAEARVYLAATLKKAGVDVTSPDLPTLATTIPDLVEPDNRMYGATANELEPHWGYFAFGVSRSQISRAVPAVTNTREWHRKITELQPTVANLAGIIEHFATELTARAAAQAGTAYDSWEAKGIAMRSTTANEHQGRVIVVNTTVTNGYQVYAISPYPASELELVADLRSLNCATTGLSDGVPCDPSWITWRGPEDTTELDLSLALLIGGGANIYPTWASTATVAEVRRDRSLVRWQNNGRFSETEWILRLIPGRPAETPGSYEVVGGHDSFTNSAVYSFSYPLAPSLWKAAGGIVQPDPENWSGAAQTCVEMIGGFDDRMPLENSLNEDESSYENSWEFYLTQAEAAAERADALGEQAFNSTVELSRISEGALTELERICGEGVSIDPLDIPIGTGTQDPVEYMSELAEDSPGSPLAKIAQCLGPDLFASVPGFSDLTFVGLGTGELCAYRPTGENAPRGNDSLCQWNGDPDHRPQCPVSIDVDDPCTAPSGDYEAVRIPAENMLNLFEAPRSIGTGLAHTSGGCRIVRDMRHSIATNNFGLAALQHFVVARSGLFDPGTVQELARQIRWVATPGSNSALVLADSTVYSTGTLEGGPSTQNFCNPNDSPNVSGGGCTLYGDDEEFQGEKYGLFCQAFDCEHVASRSALNTRLANAAIAARWLGQEALSGFVMPRYDDEKASLSYIRKPYDTGPNEYPVASGTLSNGSSVYCYDPEESPYEIWRFNRGRNWLGEDWPGLPPADFEPACANRRNIIFHELQPGKYNTGRHLQPSTTLINQNHANARDFLRRLALTMNGDATTPFNVRNPLDQYRLAPSNPLVEIACAGSGCTAEFPWAYASRVDDWQSFWDPSDRDWWYLRDVVDEQSDHIFFNPERKRFTREQVLDAIELLCETSYATAVVSSTPTLPDADLDLHVQFRLGAAQIQRSAARIRQRGATSVIDDVPTSVVQQIRNWENSTVPLALSGQMGAQANAIAEALTDISTVSDSVAAELDGLALDQEALADAIETADLQIDRTEVELFRVSMEETFKCANAITGAWVPKGWMQPGQAAFTCATALTNIAAAIQVQKIDARLAELGRGAAAREFQQRTMLRAVAIGQLEARLAGGISRIRSATDQIEVLRDQGRQALAQAMFFGQSGTGILYRSNVATRRRLATEVERYQRAWRDAIMHTYLAKRSIENHFGVRLADLHEDMGLVEAPADWESQLCSMTGINFDEIVENTGDIVSTTPNSGHYADQYVGEYTRRLRNFVTAYPSVYPFLDDEDTAVISLRDDVFNVREMCPMPVRNELYYSAELGVRATDSEPGWREYCAESAAGIPDVECTALYSLEGDPAIIAPRNWPAALGTIKPYRVVFGPPDPDCPVDPGPLCAWDAASAYGQAVQLRNGRYRMSWYTRGTGTQQSGAVEIRRAAGSWSVANTTPPAMSTEWPKSVGNGWYRYWFTFDAPGDEAVDVVIANASGNDGDSVDIGGLMLEHLGPDSQIYSTDAYPGSFAATLDTLETETPACEDLDGSEFQQQSWEYKCEHLCSSGFGFCPDTETEEYCYWETKFRITQHAIEQGDILQRAGFAHGSFNYRIESFALNFVGTAARSCQNDDLPSTCYNAGFIPYSLTHLGPYTVRNHMGEDYEVGLFTGIIENADGLAAERYITRPISSTDAYLLDQFTERQFRGRPIDGEYVLRIWDEPGVNFAGIEDVQLILNYRFWTRQR